MLERDKNCIEFSMHSMMATHKPCQEDTEIAIKGMAPGKNLLFANNPFDIPCDVVVVSKGYFEALQTENEQLKKKLAVPDPLSEFRELLEKLYSKDDAENLEWALNHTVGGRGSVNGWRAVSSFWSEKYKKLSKLVGFSSVEEIEDYLTNEVECDTLHEAILKLIDENKYACDEWYSANSQNNSWKAAAECNSPKELIENIKGFREEIEMHYRLFKEWKTATGCPSPSAAKNAIDSTESWHQAYKDVKAANEKLAGNVKSWQNATGYSTPGGFLSAMINYPDNVWRDATGFSSPLAANIGIRDYKNTIEKLKEITECKTLVDIINGLDQEIDKWQKATGCDSPEETKSRIEGLENAIRLTNKNMIKEIENTIDEWQKATGCVSPGKAERKITDLYNRIDKMKEAATIASNWADKIVEG